MNNLFFLVPPKHRLAQVSGRWIFPISVPSGANTWTPLYPSPPPSSSGPDIAIYIATNAVGIARRHIYKKAPIGQSNAIDVIHVNRMCIGGMLRHTGVHQVELFL